MDYFDSDSDDGYGYYGYDDDWDMGYDDDDSWIPKVKVIKFRDFYNPPWRPDVNSYFHLHLVINAATNEYEMYKQKFPSR